MLSLTPPGCHRSSLHYHPLLLPLSIVTAAALPSSLTLTGHRVIPPLQSSIYSLSVIASLAAAATSTDAPLPLAPDINCLNLLIVSIGQYIVIRHPFHQQTAAVSHHQHQQSSTSAVGPPARPPGLPGRRIASPLRQFVVKPPVLLAVAAAAVAACCIAICYLFTYCCYYLFICCNFASGPPSTLPIDTVNNDGQIYQFRHRPRLWTRQFCTICAVYANINKSSRNLHAADICIMLPDIQICCIATLARQLQLLDIYPTEPILSIIHPALLLFYLQRSFRTSPSIQQRLGHYIIIIIIINRPLSIPFQPDYHSTITALTLPAFRRDAALTTIYAQSLARRPAPVIHIPPAIPAWTPPTTTTAPSTIHRMAPPHHRSNQHQQSPGCNSSHIHRCC